MKKQIIVIGLGQFGMGLIKALSRKNVDVIAIDTDEKKIQMASAYAAEAYCMDGTQEDSLASLNPRLRDVCICATGDQSKEAAIISTALLKQMGAKRVIARANDDLHARILKLVGADEVINPEWEFGAKFANRIVNEDIIEEMSLGEDLVVTEIKIPQSFLGKNIVDLDLRRKFEITVVAVRNSTSGLVRLPQPSDILEQGDIMIVVSRQDCITKMLAANGR